MDEWLAMENAGAVFFPAAGGRRYTQVYNVNTSGGCWSSTVENGVPRDIGFESSGVNEHHSDSPYYGKNVRLVRVVDM